jgi:phosphoglycolate phosphatase
MKSLVIFDLDGTLLNTIDDLGAASNYALAQAGYPTHHISSYPHFVGNGITRLLERVVPAGEDNPENIAKLREIFTGYYNEHLADFTRPYPGITELVDELASRNVAMAVASNKYIEATRALVTHFFPNTPWVAIEGQRTGVPVKPDPSIVFGILSQHPTPKANTIYVGDSAVDMETARRAAIESVGVSWGFRTVRELNEAYADHIIDSPQQLLSLL